MKKFMHTPREVADMELSPQRKHRERAKHGVHYFDESGKLLEEGKVAITKATCELGGVYPYIFNFLSYVCVQAPELVKLGDTESVYYMISAPIEKFIEITLGKNAGQSHRLKKELDRLFHKRELQPKLIPFDNPTTGEKQTIYGPPIWAAISVKRAAEAGHKNVNESENGVIQIFFLKPLFQNAVSRTGQYINEPKSFFAMIYEAVEQHAQEQREDISTPEFEENASAFALMIMKTWHYLNVHDNDKGKTKTFNLVSLLLDVEPTKGIGFNGDVPYVRQWGKDHVETALLILSRLTKANRKIVSFVIELADDKTAITQKTNGETIEWTIPVSRNPALAKP
jgi:hypothetical protein